MKRALPTLLFVTVLAACGSDPTGVSPRDVEFAPQLGVDLDAMIRTSSGLYYEDLEVGHGTAALSGRVVSVLFQGWLPDGTLFDQRLNPSDPLRFRLGVGIVIPGWDEGLAGMRVGGMRRLVIPSNLGYGNQSQGIIPANSVLVFDIQLASVTLD